MVSKKGRRPPNKEVATAEEIEAWRYRQQGWTQTRIADVMAISQQKVSVLLRKASDRVNAELTELVKQHKAEQIEQLNFIIDESLRSWEASKKTAKYLERRLKDNPAALDPARPLAVPGPDGQPVPYVSSGGPLLPGQVPAKIEEAITRVEEQLGDVRYLQEARAALTEMRKILGIEAPVKSINYTKDVSQMTDEELDAILNS